MGDTRSVAKRFGERITALDFMSAFGMVADDGVYTVIGKTGASGVYHGAQDIYARLVPVLASFEAPPVLAFEEPIVDGDRAVLVGSGSGEGPTGPYDQPHYAFVMRVRGEELVEVTEFMDTGALESAVFGRKLIEAREEAMADNSATIARSNVELATDLMRRFGHDMDGWYDHLHEDIVMEFPFGPSVGMPSRVEGKAACSAVFAAVVEGVQVQFDNIRVSPLADPNRLVVEYTGYSEPNGKVYDQTYISVQEFRDGKMILFREYWNALIVKETFGDLSALGS
jgi:ketosteroid isomerase-like protein